MELKINGIIEKIMPPFYNGKQQKQQTIFVRVAGEKRAEMITLFGDLISKFASCQVNKKYEFACSTRGYTKSNGKIINYKNAIDFNPA